MPRRSRLAAGLLAVLVAATSAGCTVPTFAPNGSPPDGRPLPADSTAPNEPGTAQWRPCPEVPQQLVGKAASGVTYSCATVQVPRDWSAAGTGETYPISLIRVRSDAQRNRLGSLLINPGGPGASGVDFTALLSFGAALGGLPTEITNRFDLVGFDPRGVGRSAAIKCIAAADQDASFAAPPDPVSQADFDSLVALNKRIADGCNAKYGSQLPLYATEQAAKDLEALREAVGDDKMNYLGFSYGTLLGATYAQLHPDKIRAMVLDGAIDAKEGYVARNESQAKGFERALTNFSTWCRQTSARCPIGPDARKAVTDAVAAAGSKPVPYTDGRKATAGWIFLAVVSSLYAENSWPTLAKAIADLRQNNAMGVFTLADQYAERKPDGTYSNLFDANLAVNCADTKDAPSIDEIRRLQGQWRAKYPFFGAAVAVGMVSCTVWPGDRDPYPAGAAKGAPPIVVVGTTGDPATPYENTARLASMLGVGHVVTWEGEGHTAYPSTQCIVRAVDAYLLALQVPQQGLRCPAR